MTMINNLMRTTGGNQGVSKRWAFLYDIGCNIEKGIQKVCFFGWLMFDLSFLMSDYS